MKIGLVLHKIQDSNIFIVDVGWGQLRYFFSNKHYEEGDIILYNEKSRWELKEENEENKYYESRDAWLKDEANERLSFDSNEIEPVCSFDDCDFLGNVRFDFYPQEFTKSNIVIARTDKFVYWQGYRTDEYISHGPMQSFDVISNSLLFLTYAERRYPSPDEKEWLKAYTFARNKLEKLDVPKMIEELKVEFIKSSWTRRGSDNVMISYYYVCSNYDPHFGYIGDKYLEKVFPEYSEHLYSSKDGECEYIHPKFEPKEIIRNHDGSVEITKEKYDGLDIEDYCAIKTKELHQIALKNYESYNKDEHVNYIAYHHINWHLINVENELFLKMKCLAEIIWGFNHHKLLDQITKENYKELIENNNNLYPIPSFPKK